MHNTVNPNDTDEMNYFSAFNDAVTNINKLISNVDAALSLVNDGLNATQPPSDGKIGILFGNKSGQGKKTPFPVVWRFSSRNTWYPEYIGFSKLPLRAKRNGGFQHQYHFTHKLLKYAVTLFERRARLVKGRRDALQVLIKLYDYNLLSTHMETSEIIAIRNEALINRADIITENPNHGGALKNDTPHEIKTPETH